MNTVAAADLTTETPARQFTPEQAAEGQIIVVERIAYYRSVAVRERNYAAQCVSESGKVRHRVKSRVADAHADCLQAFVDSKTV